MSENYLNPLPKGVSLAVFDSERLIFSSGGKWLHPLFEAGEYLEKNNIVSADLSLHDTIGGLAAAFLSIRLGVKKVNVDMISDLALDLYKEYGVEVHYTKHVERIKCITETMITRSMSVEEAYRKLRQKANLTSGLSLRLDGLSFSYGERKVVDNLDLYLEKGDTLILEGDNGCGKTTLLRLILGLEKPSGGSILFDGKPQRPAIGYVKQLAEKQNFPFTAREVVSLSLPDEAKDREGEIELVMRRTGSYELRDRLFFSLSGGEMARVNLARVLASKARLLLFDEPTASLDREAKENFAAIMASLSVTEMPTMLIVNHDRVLSDLLKWPTRRLEGGILV